MMAEAAEDGDTTTIVGPRVPIEIIDGSAGFPPCQDSVPERHAESPGEDEGALAQILRHGRAERRGSKRAPRIAHESRAEVGTNAERRPELQANLAVRK